jgi:hypothetical protein
MSRSNKSYYIPHNINRKIRHTTNISMVTKGFKANAKEHLYKVEDS